MFGDYIVSNFFGYKVGVVDLTTGELGTRGTPELRLEEANEAAKIMGLSCRDYLGMRDGFFKNDEAHQLQVIASIRKYQPNIVLANAIDDRHPDHGRAAELIRDAFFLSGLRMIETKDEDGNIQEPWRPRILMHYIQDRWIKPDIVVDISPFIDKKIEAIKLLSLNFTIPIQTNLRLILLLPIFFEGIPTRAKEMGRASGFNTPKGLPAQRC